MVGRFSHSIEQQIPFYEMPAAELVLAAADSSRQTGAGSVRQTCGDGRASLTLKLISALGALYAIFSRSTVLVLIACM